MKPPAQPATSSAASTAPAAASARRRGPGKWRKLLPWVVLGALLAGIVAGLRPKPVAVETGLVSEGALSVSILEEGKTRIRHRYTISPPVAGWLNRIPLRAGDRIEAGKTVLATIQAQPASFLDPRARSEAEARLKAAEAAQQRTSAELERTQSDLELAKKEKTRSDELRRTGAISAREWDAAENQVNVLTRALHSAEFAVRVAEFEVAQAQATLKQTQVPDGAASSEPLSILAPVTGYVLQVFEESARVVTAGMPLLEVGDPTDLEAEIELLSSDAVGVQPGAEVSIEQWGGDQPLRGRVSVVEPGGYTKVSSLGVEEQRVKVRVEFVDPPPGARLGDRFRVEARIVTWQSPKVLQVPTGALFRRGNQWMVFTLEGGRAQLRPVEIGRNNGRAAEVRSGLRSGDTVILHPPDVVGEGASVRPRQ